MLWRVQQRNAPESLSWETVDVLCAVSTACAALGTNSQIHRHDHVTDTVGSDMTQTKNHPHVESAWRRQV